MMRWNPPFPKVTELPKQRGSYVIVSYDVRRAESAQQALVDLRWILAFVIPCYALVEAPTHEIDNTARFFVGKLRAVAR
jgi:hypothetical protein